jgi:hypothetical protein
MANELIEIPFSVRRVVLVRFARGGSGAPNGAYPEIDDRGSGAELGPVVGITAGDTIKVALERVNIDNTAELSVKSLDESVAKIVSSAKLANDPRVTIEIKGMAGGEPEPKVARIQVSYDPKGGSPTVIAELQAWVYKLAELPVRIFDVTVNGDDRTDRKKKASIGATLSKAKRETMFTTINHIWRPCGIHFNAESGGTVSIDSPLGGVVAGYDRDNLTAKKYGAKFINVYYIPTFRSPGLLGQGFGKMFKSAGPVKLAAVYQATQTLSSDDPETAKLENVSDEVITHSLAHELGHYLGLKHVHDPGQVYLFSRKCLMHNAVTIAEMLSYQREGIGYGNLAGKLIQQKTLGYPNEAPSRCAIARTTISTGEVFE